MVWEADCNTSRTHETFILRDGPQKGTTIIEYDGTVELKSAFWLLTPVYAEPIRALGCARARALRSLSPLLPRRWRSGASGCRCDGATQRADAPIPGGGAAAAAAWQEGVEGGDRAGVPGREAQGVGQWRRWQQQNVVLEEPHASPAHPPASRASS